ncbi:AraC family transcriptional regulator [Legionella maioricensis]|uniref:Helix-turn-helix domain-containing protein n=1 Tax=Legionella maioricensis TaxID=2896528 RepID=A0A9X2CXV6_9GAMM|nr:helix-turn-helix domain-containing protein [Legionella maioricensis]MCL9682741.1 helix-turn-helix domain-containing protein [Legionella maioricensis]MCL9687211.1 helix-turn-helix domain-containing protein [Legionella maioricensis]
MYKERETSLHLLTTSNQAIWHSSVAPKNKMLILPDSATDIIIKRTTFGIDIVFCGTMTKAVMIEREEKIDYWGFRFKPGHGSQFFNFPMEETLDQLVDISQNFEKNKIEDLMEFPEINSLKIEQEISKFLFKKINSIQYQENIKRINHLAEMNFGDISKHASKEKISRRQLYRIFKNYFGYPARDLSQTRKLNQFIKLSQQKSTTSLSDLAIASGYYDQADMNKSIKNLCGLTPKELMSQLYNTV